MVLGCTLTFTMYGVLYQCESGYAGIRGETWDWSSALNQPLHDQNCVNRLCNEGVELDPSMIIYLKEIDESNQEKANYFSFRTMLNWFELLYTIDM